MRQVPAVQPGAVKVTDPLNDVASPQLDVTWTDTGGGMAVLLTAFSGCA